MWFLVGWGHRCESQLNRTGPFNVEDQCVKPIGTQAFPFLLPELPNALYSTLKNAVQMSCGVARLEAPVLSHDDFAKTDFPFFNTAGGLVFLTFDSVLSLLRALYSLYGQGTICLFAQGVCATN
jgi:hypothetical protein